MMDGRYRQMKDLEKLLPTEHEFKGAFLEKLRRAYEMGRDDLWNEIEQRNAAFEAIKAEASTTRNVCQHDWEERGSTARICKSCGRKEGSGWSDD